MNGSEIAKSGYKEEKLVCKDLNNELIKQNLKPTLGDDYDKCDRIQGKHKCDIQSDNKNLSCQVKKYKPGQFQQLDRHWVDVLTKNIPELEEVSEIFKDFCEYPLLKDGKKVDKSKPLKKLCNTNYSQDILDKFLNMLNKYKKQILEYAFLGTNIEMQPEYLVGVEYNKNKNRKKIVAFRIRNIINYLETLEFKISPKKTRILLGDKGTISLQRKGGDKGNKSSNQLQIKIILSNLIDKVDNSYYNL